ncbi:MAG: esterase family protein [Bacteroidales bacterium]|nr:esterase family protein [Bacteroidales bacterium]
MKNTIKIVLLLVFVFSNKLAKTQSLYVVNSHCKMPNDTVMVYTPNKYNNDSITTYPAVILLNGYGGNFRQWSKVSDLQLYADEYQMILICPDGFYDSWYIDSPIDTNSCYSTYFKQEILPSIFEQYRIDKNNLFITGLSMGGHGALYLFIQNSEYFAAVGSMSGVLDLKYSSVANTSLAKKIGPKQTDNPNWETYSVINQAIKLKEINKPIIINCGSEDFLIKVNRRFATKCKNLGINIVYAESPGKHDRIYWKLTLPSQLMFFRQFVQKNKRYEY